MHYRPLVLHIIEDALGTELKWIKTDVDLNSKYASLAKQLKHFS